MGFFDKLKSVKNALTGGAADVTVEVGEARTDSPVQVRVTATAKANFPIKRVYLLVRSVEEAVVHDIDVERDGSVRREAVHGEVETCNMEVDIADALDLEEGETYEWETEIELPQESNPTFHGNTIRHVWMIQAAIDSFGNDPDSGWVEFHTF